MTAVQKLIALAETAKVKDKMEAMFTGDHVNMTEDRAALHTALRASRKAKIYDEGSNVMPEVWKVLDKIKKFSGQVRSGEWLGHTGKQLKNVVCIGIGGSYLGPLFVHTALSTDQSAMQGAGGRTLRFLANVDPIDVAKALKGALQALHLCGVCVSKSQGDWRSPPQLDRELLLFFVD
jgi:glucose-6-phosphate isomerase